MPLLLTAAAALVLAGMDRPRPGSAEDQRPAGAAARRVQTDATPTEKRPGGETDSPIAAAIAVVDDASNRVMLFDAGSGAYISDLAPRSDALDMPFGCGAATLPFPPGDPVRTVVVSDLRRRRIVAYDVTSGGLVRVLIDNVTARGVAQVPTGDLLVAAGKSGVRRYKSDGTFVSTFALDIVDGPNNAWDVLVFSPDSDQYEWLALVSDPTLDAVYLYESKGNRLATFAALPEFRHPEQLARRSNGNVLVTDPMANAVFEFDAFGAHLRTIGVTRPRGVVELDGGDLLIAGEEGVQVFSGSTGGLLSTSMPGFPSTAPRYVCRLTHVGAP